MFAYIIDEPAVHLQAPEVASGGFYTGKEDVYGLSMTPLQMHTRRPIQEAHDPGGTRNRAPSRNMVLHCAVKGRRPPIPDDMPEPLVELMTSCWAHDPDDRPTAPRVLEMLKSIQETLWVKGTFDGATHSSSSKGGIETTDSVANPVISCDEKDASTIMVAVGGGNS